MATYAVWQATVTDNQGNITSGATVTVRSESTGILSDIFETRLGTAKSNPFTTGADGFAQFYAAPGLYRIEATSPEGTAEWRNVRLIEVATPAEALAGTPGVLPDAAGVHAAFGQYGLGSKGTRLGANFNFNSLAALIDVEVNHPVYGWIPFTASPNDTESHGILIYQAALNGAYGEVQPYVKSEAEYISEALSERNRRISDIDRVASNPILWGELSEEEQAKMTSDRKTLTEIEQQEGFPQSVAWPE